MLLIIISLLLVINAITAFRNIRNGIAMYVILSFLSPHLKLLGETIPYEFIGFYIVIIPILIRTHKFKKLNYLVVIYFSIDILLLITSTYIYYLNNGGEIHYLGVFGKIRYGILSLVILSVLNREDIKKIVFFILVINFLVSLSQFIIIDSVDTYHDLYASEKSTFLNQYLILGFIPRAVGTVGSPIILGSLALFTFAISLYGLFFKKVTLANIVFVSISLTTGLITLTKTFVLGLPIIISYIILLKIFEFRTKTSGKELIYLSVFLFVATILSVLVITYLSQKGHPIFYYLDFLLNPLDSLETRYSDNIGTLSETQKVISQNFILGIGRIVLPNVFLGDSTYAVTLYETGIVGISLLTIFLMTIFIKLSKEQDKLGILILIIFVLSGLAYPTLYYLTGSIILSFAIAKNETKEFIIGRSLSSTYWRH